MSPFDLRVSSPMRIFRSSDAVAGPGDPATSLGSLSSASKVAFEDAIRKSRSCPLMRSTGPWSAVSRAMLSPCAPELNTPIVSTRGSAPSSIDMNPPHDWPMTATLSRAILPLSGDPSRLSSVSAHAMALRRLSAVARVPAAAPGSAAVARTTKPCDAMVVRKPP